MSGALCSDSSGNSHMLSCVCLECLCFDSDYRTPKGVETVAKRQYSRSKTWCMLLFGDKLIWTDFLETFATLEIKFLWTQEKVWPRNFLHIYFVTFIGCCLNPSYIVLTGHRKPFDLHFLILQPLLQSCTFYPWEDRLRNWSTSLRVLWTILPTGLQHRYATLLFPAALVLFAEEISLSYNYWTAPKHDWFQRSARHFFFFSSRTVLIFANAQFIEIQPCERPRKRGKDRRLRSRKRGHGITLLVICIAFWTTEPYPSGQGPGQWTGRSWSNRSPLWTAALAVTSVCP